MTIETTIETEPLPDIDDLRHQIDRIDAEILAAVRHRTEVSQEIGRARIASGGTRLVHSREMKSSAPQARISRCCCCVSVEAVSATSLRVLAKRRPRL